MNYSRVIYSKTSVKIILSDGEMEIKDYLRLKAIVDIDSVKSVVIEGSTYDSFEYGDFKEFLRKLKSDFHHKDINVKTRFSLNEICTSSMSECLVYIDNLHITKNNVSRICGKKDFYCIHTL